MVSIVYVGLRWGTAAALTVPDSCLPTTTGTENINLTDVLTRPLSLTHSLYLLSASFISLYGLYDCINAEPIDLRWGRTHFQGSSSQRQRQSSAVLKRD